MSTVLTRPGPGRLASLPEAVPPGVPPNAPPDAPTDAPPGFPRMLRWGAGSLIAVGLAALVVLAGFNLRWNHMTLRGELEDRADETSIVWAANVEFRIRTLTSYLQSSAARPAVVDLVRAGPQMAPSSELSDLSTAYPTLVSMNAVDRSGRIVASSAGSQLVGSDLSRREEFLQAQAGQIWASPVYASPLAGHPLVVNLVAPVRSADGTTVGYLMATASLAKAQGLAMPLPKDGGLEISLVDQSGATILASSGRSLGQVDPAGEAWLGPALRGERGVRTVHTDRGTQVVAFRPTAYGWVAVAALPLSTVEHPLTTLRNSTIALAGGLALVIALLGLLLQRANRRRERVIARLDATRGELADALARLQVDAAERQRIAREVNDTIVQTLVASEISYDLGRDGPARDLLHTATRQARDWVGQLIADDGGLQPGDARLRHVSPGDGERA